jgi:hypothetical protein
LRWAQEERGKSSLPVENFVDCWARDIHTGGSEVPR